MAQKNAISETLMNHQGRPVVVNTGIPQQHVPPPQLYCDMPIAQAPSYPRPTPSSTPRSTPSTVAPSAPAAPSGPSDREQFASKMEEAFVRAGFEVSKKSMFTFALSSGAKQEIVDTETVYYMWRNNPANSDNVIHGFVQRKLNDFSR